MISIQEKIGLAREFSTHLRFELSDEQLKETVRRNAEDESKYGADICHSHDFCDANMVMLQAWQEFFGQEPDLNDDADIAIWGDAWAIAKASDFFPAG